MPNAGVIIMHQNLILIEERNAAEAYAGGSAQHGITRFADLSQDEFASRYLKTSVSFAKTQKPNLISLKPPEGFGKADWTGVYTTPVKDQVKKRKTSLKEFFFYQQVSQHF